VAGSHKWPEYSPFHFQSGEKYAATGQPELPDIEAGVKSGKFKLLDFGQVNPGDCIVFSGMTVHGQMSQMDRKADESDESDEEEYEGTAGPMKKNAKQQPPQQFRRLATRWTGDNARYILREGEAKDVLQNL
jgi:hypothetical protein